MSKPKIGKGPASQYAGPDETIVEFSHGRGSTLLGGLISIRRAQNGELTVCVYRHDKGVMVIEGERG